MGIHLNKFCPNLQGDPYDSSDEEWCHSLRMRATTWNRFRNGDFQPKVDVDVDIDGFIRDAFTIADMLHDESKRELDGVEPM
jgi:hypothetical protein